MRLGISRNDPCPCGSGKKYKKCCLDRDDSYSRQLTSAAVDVDLLDDLLDGDDFEEDSLFEALLFTAEQQVREQRPPEVRQTLIRLRRMGLDRAHIMDMIAHVMLHETQRAETEGGEPNIPRYVSQLQRLPALDCEHPEVNAQSLTEEEAP